MDQENAGGAGRADLLGTVGSAARGVPGGRVVTASVVCPMCGSPDSESAEFEASGGECFCVACCLPIGILDGDIARAFGRADASLWKLTPGPSAEPAALDSCPDGHGVFQMAVALCLDADDSVRGVTVGLRCVEDGGLHLYVDNARVTTPGA
ncbi:hypothetical protein Q5762_01810 [Streptomyces sp. P9(2023)]|uniref:hypothetical protein n=1 Tax=Streptomyces sp. P9(2023) TaxID=3064394 RepID=UPI0028F414E5|nr:hypothetical protein [Streptomyces sp. P9(2023)]MDT9687103.1 hypothetical protein [Streptomyces sp. P9(2023)]